MNDIEAIPEHVQEVIKFMNENVPLDGTYRIAVLKTAAAYFEAMVHAESMNAIIMKSFNSLPYRCRLIAGYKAHNLEMKVQLLPTATNKIMNIPILIEHDWSRLPVGVIFTEEDILKFKLSVPITKELLFQVLPCGIRVTELENDLVVAGEILEFSYDKTMKGIEQIIPE